VTLDVRIEQQSRKSLALRVTPGGLVALIPRDLDPDSATVQRFIERGLARLPEPESPVEPLTSRALHALIEEWAGRLGVQVERVQVRQMRTKWASCSERGRLTLNRDILTLPRDLVDYILCHELLHVKLPGHGKGWQAMMSIYVPDWRERERRLAGWVLALE
jgi:hypothetical protein